eukprot:4437997-Pleurochrysis_carterae.AAC.1
MGARRRAASLAGTACRRAVTLSAPPRRPSSTPPLRLVLALAAEHDLELQGGHVTQAYPQADWPTDQT